MTSPCEQLVERLAIGESLEPLAEHLAGCAGCRALALLPRQIGAARRPVDPGLGFAARMTVGAQHRIVVRRRQRLAAGLAATMAAGALAAVYVTREPAATRPAVAVEAPRPRIDEAAPPTPAAPAEAELRALVNLADTERAMHLSADWRAIEAPLAPYRTLVHAVAAHPVAAPDEDQGGEP